ncbi:malonyl-coenzyme A:anthocyanin 3-O-glucoside-6''-O-malonyltransferase-like [Magnolia sinica]|uniref:malonyl-coenzyme A:anthocyanin 3-O-glucoside-6''-O-malonyltransferase-like n=1 Tax=Magnolia sinica TaxID=86752 RepID=UPI002658C083|nr:malonyl-coenzyme A:anthocyanin 3-O-glucoside-6''-O-malonyltransferase-like [Magnolia sinica]
MAEPRNLKVLEVCRVSPPPGSVADTSLPLTVFDVFWLVMPPVQRLFFYQFPQNSNKTHFIDTLLPKLKHSLFLSLRLFFPLAGNLILSPKSGEHEIRYIDGDSVSLTVAESDADFHRLAANHPRDVLELHPLVPQLPVSDTQNQPLLALQVTIFPDSGICIGTSISHAVADGSSSMHFMKSWASICRSGDESLIKSRPFYDRSVAAYLDGLKRLRLDQMATFKLDQAAESLKPRATPVLAAFVMGRADIDTLRQRVLAQRSDDSQKPIHTSSFVLTCAYVWVCLIRSRGDDDRDKNVHFAFAVDCRARLDPPIPATYFGNCIDFCLCNVKGNDLLTEDGVGPASEAIGRAIQALNDGVLNSLDTLKPTASSIVVSGENFLTVAGSPKFRVYETDFGWGKPVKVEVISIERTGAISLAESRDEEGGIEVGLVLSKSQMERFASLFEEGLNNLRH